MLITNEGIVMRTPVDSVSLIGRNTQGVIVMNIEKGSEVKLAGMARLTAEFLEQEEEELPEGDETEEAKTTEGEGAEAADTTPENEE